ncbi:MAG TPA: hypothetical protein VEI97_20090 [bacterium]|nr:hypothetical protein [bacterium]
MSPRALAAGLTTGSLLAAMVTGAVLMTPSFAKEEKGHAPRGKREKEIRVIRHHGPSHELSADEMRERVDELQDSLGDHEERLEEARRLLDKAGDALRDGDESVARALLMEAERLLHHGPPMHDFLMMAPPAPGMPPMPPMAHGMV